MAIDNRFGGNMEQSNSGIRSLRRGPTEDTFQPTDPYSDYVRRGLNPMQNLAGGKAVGPGTGKAGRGLISDDPRQPGIGIQNNRATQEENGFEKFNDYVRRGLNPIQNAGQGLMDLLGSGYNKLDEILDFKGMGEQIPYVLDNFIPGYEPPEGYYDDDYDGEPMAELGMNPYDVADLDDDNIAAQILASQGYGNEDIISMLSSRSI